MNYPRHFATAELDNDGNMWMIGGRKIHNDFDVSNAAPDSEVYKIDSKEWIPNAPLPEELKHGGVTDHCTVRLNSTHVMLISGKKQGFFFEDANAEQTGFGTKETADGGIVTNKAWMLGRESWKEVADLSIPRLQAACSILPDERDGSVSLSYWINFHRFKTFSIT